MQRITNSILATTICLLAIFSLSILFNSTSNSTPTQATQKNLDISLSIQPSLSLSLSNCDSTNSSTLNLNLTPTPNGTFKSNCQELTVLTNTPGYALSTKSSSTTLDYLNPTTINPKPTINSTTNTTTSPNTLTNNTWGFATENQLNFDPSYTIDNPNNNYSQLPTTDTPIYSESGFPYNNH